MKVIVTGRQYGKTSRLVEWVLAGAAIDRYPFWSRVILTISIAEADRLRREYSLDYSQVFSADEWAGRAQQVRGAHVEAAIDNLDLWAQQELGPLAAASLTGEML